jgi:hypothetical protein
VALFLRTLQFVAFVLVCVNVAEVIFQLHGRKNMRSPGRPPGKQDLCMAALPDLVNVVISVVFLIFFGNVVEGDEREEPRPRPRADSGGGSKASRSQRSRVSSEDDDSDSAAASSSQHQHQHQHQQPQQQQQQGGRVAVIVPRDPPSRAPPLPDSQPPPRVAADPERDAAAGVTLPLLADAR